MVGKKFLRGVSIIMALFLLTGCRFSYEDVIPDDYELGLWEGNYIYQGNLRTKTTGENTETLVSEIIYDGKKYTMGDTEYYRFVDNDIYMIVRATTPSKHVNWPDDDVFVLLKYSPQNEEAEFYYTARFLPEFSYISSEYCIFEDDNSVLKIDFSTKEVINIPLSGKHYIVGDYLIIKSDGRLQYTKLDQIEFKTIMEDNDYDYRLKIVEKDSHKYLRILATKTIDEPFAYYSELTFMDLETDSMQIVWSFSNNKKLSLIDDDYFVVGDTKGFDYVSIYYCLDSREHEVLTKYLSVNNELYEINYSDSNISCEKIYTFNLGKDYISYASGYIDESGNLVFNAEWVEKGSQDFPGGVEEKYYLLDLEKMILSEYKQSFGNSTPIYYQQPIEYGEFKYYFETEFYGGFWVGYTAYFLYRQNLTTNKVELMQSFSSESDNMGLRFAEGFWHYDFIFDQSHFLILNY